MVPEKFYNNLGINTIEDGYNHFMVQWENYTNGNGLGDYPEKIYNLA